MATDRALIRNRLSDYLNTARGKWRWTGVERPPFAETPREGQESVWDYPRPPAMASDTRRVRVFAEGLLVADSCQAIRLLETASAPTFYVPPGDVKRERLVEEQGSSLCEWKGAARYYSVVTGTRRIEHAAWDYPEPFPPYDGLAGYIAFYPSKLECYVDEERVRAQHGGFYGGWVTAELVGPFKGGPGSAGW